MKKIVILSFICCLTSSVFSQIEYKYRIDSLKINKNRIEFNKILNSAIVTDTIYVYNPTDSTIAINFERVADYISIKATPEKVKAHEAGIIVISFNAQNSKIFGYIRERIFVKTGLKSNSQNMISISGMIEEDFSKLSKKDIENAAKIEFENTVFNFDTLQQGESVSFVFKFKNTGKSDLIIRSTKASCGCTATKPAKEIIAPGEDSEINVTFNSHGKHGLQNKSITVISNSPSNSTITLLLKGYVNAQP